MNTYRTLAAVTLALSAFAAQADSGYPRDGDGNNYPASTQTGSPLTREAVVAELLAARAAGTLPQDYEWKYVHAAMGFQSATALSRAEVRNDAMVAAKANRTSSAE